MQEDLSMMGEVTFLLALALWAMTGCLAGLLFGLIMGTGKRGGILEYVFLGIIGAVLSGLFIRALWSGSMQNWQVNIMAGSVGALILIAIAEYSHRRIATKKTSR
jgi:uncharacterized membrane protein YeaQ/YmgE (transglycosylase-associated protein family)